MGDIVYLEIIRRGYDVVIGEINNMGIDFIASNIIDKKNKAEK